MHKARAATAFARLLCFIAMSVALAACWRSPDDALGHLSSEARERGEIMHAHTPNCLDQLAQKTAVEAETKYPSSTTNGDWILQRNEYVRAQTWVTFDNDHDQTISFEEYLSMQWAFFLAYRTNRDCSLSKADFLSMFLGVPHTPTSGWDAPYQPSVVGGVFDSLDVGKKGFLTKEDIRRQSSSSFSLMDRNHDGRLSTAEMGPAYAPMASAQAVATP